MIMIITNSALTECICEMVANSFKKSSLPLGLWMLEQKNLKQCHDEYAVDSKDGSTACDLGIRIKNVS